jgi:hypothetical protein
MSDWYRQFGGIIVDGKRVIYVNAFRAGHLDAQTLKLWRTTAIKVCGGGVGYFGAEYDPSTNQVTSITFNSNAESYESSSFASTPQQA